MWANGIWSMIHRQMELQSQQHGVDWFVKKCWIPLFVVHWNMGKATALSISHSATWPCEKGFVLPAKMGLLRAGLRYKPASHKSSKHMKTRNQIQNIQPWSLDYTASLQTTALPVDVASVHWLGALDVRHNVVNPGNWQKVTSTESIPGPGSHPKSVFFPECVAVARVPVRLHTLHSTLHTPHSTLYTLHFTLYTLHYTLHTLHYILHSSLHTLHSTLHTLHSTL